MNRYLQQYEIAVQQPGVSGFEVLEMLMARDTLYVQSESLSIAETSRLAAADRDFLVQIPLFYEELTRITSLDYERRQRQPTPEQWWWYLDVLVEAPTPLTRHTDLYPAPA